MALNTCIPVLGGDRDKQIPGTLNQPGKTICTASARFNVRLCLNGIRQRMTKHGSLASMGTHTHTNTQNGFH